MAKGVLSIASVAVAAAAAGAAVVRGKRGDGAHRGGDAVVAKGSDTSSRSRYARGRHDDVSEPGAPASLLASAAPAAHERRGVAAVQPGDPDAGPSRTVLALDEARARLRAQVPAGQRDGDAVPAA